MTYSQLREEIRDDVGLAFIGARPPEDITNIIITAIDTYLEEKAVEVKTMYPSSQRDFTVEYRIAQMQATRLIRSKE